MNIRIIKNTTESTDVFVKNGYMIQVQTDDSGYGDIKSVKYILYDPKKNESTEIEPSILKYNLIDIRDIKYGSDYVYFCGIKKDDGEKHKIIIYRYCISTKECTSVYTFSEKLDKYSEYMKTTIYAVNEYYLIIQNAFLRANLTEEYADYFDFEQYLCSVNEDKKYKITDERFARYGIMEFKPISTNMCMLKLGYDLLKDDRYTILKKNESSKESVGLVNIGQLVSDILISQQELVFNTIDSVFYTATIPYVKVEGEYIIYSRIKLEGELEEEIVFYNFASKDATICINSSHKDNKSSTNTCIMEGMPYVVHEGDKGYEFIDVKGKKNAFYLNPSDNIRNIIDNVIIVSGFDKGLFGKKKSYVAVYKTPTAKILHKEKGNYITSFIADNKTLYIVVGAWKVLYN